MDTEMPSVFRTKIVKANKPHSCCECKRVIQKRDKYLRCIGCWDGKWDEFKTCLACCDIRDESSDGYYGSAPFGFLREHVHNIYEGDDGFIKHFSVLEG